MKKELGRTYSVIFHHENLGADFYDDVYDLVKQTNVLLGVHIPDLLKEQENQYRRVNPGGGKQISTPINLMEGLEPNFYSLIITFTEMEVVLNSLNSGKYKPTFPVYLEVKPKRMLLIKHDVCFWYPANNTQKPRRWVELKIFAFAQEVLDQEMETNIYKGKEREKRGGETKQKEIARQSRIRLCDNIYRGIHGKYGIGKLTSLSILN